MKGSALRWVACAAMTSFAQWAPGADSDTAAAAGPPPLASGDARICFYRETWHALSVQPEVTVAGQVVGKAYPNEWFCVDRHPGTYEISTVSEPDAWLGGYSLKVFRKPPTMATAGTIVQSFSPHHWP